MSDSELRVGVLGTGAIAQVVYLPILSQMRGVQLQAVCDVDQSKASAIAGRFRIPRVLREDEEIFEADDIDAVVVCSPNHMHEGQAIAALKAGKHVLVEKPLALSAEGAERVLRAAEAADRSVMVAMNHRYRPDVRALKPFARSGEMGELFLLKAGWLNQKIRTVRPTWRHHWGTAGGGALMDLGTQVIDLCLWMLDYPKVLRVAAHTHAGEAMEVEDSAAVLIWLERGPLLSVEVSWSLTAPRDRHTINLLGTRGSASLSPLSVYKEVEHGLLDVTPQLPAGRENPYTASYRHEVAHFVEVASGRMKVEPPREQVALMNLIALAYRSAREGREVEA